MDRYSSIGPGLFRFGVGKTDQVENLQCEYLKDPLGIDATQPRLSRILASDQRGQRQTAYQVVVASSPELLKQGQGDLWDSGVSRPIRGAHVVYAGRPLGSYQRCFWKVRVWDKDGMVSDLEFAGFVVDGDSRSGRVAGQVARLRQRDAASRDP